MKKLPGWESGRCEGVCQKTGGSLYKKLSGWGGNEGVTIKNFLLRILLAPGQFFSDSLLY